MGWVWRAFDALRTCRGGMGDGPVPWTAVNDYARRFGIEGDAFERLWVWIRRMDAALTDTKDQAA